MSAEEDGQSFVDVAMRSGVSPGDPDRTLRDWFGFLSWHPCHDEKVIYIRVWRWPGEAAIGGDWWQVWRERMARLAAEYPGCRVALFDARQREFIAGLVP